MIQIALTNRRLVYNITKCIITFILIALISVGCSSDSGSSVPTDSDGDGIIDSEDSCPNTPPGNQIDENGCTTPRFTDMDDGTVLDNETGLTWLKDATALGTMNWYDGMDTVATMCDGDYGLSDGSMPGDWRLPTKEEWEYFFHPNYWEPPISNTIGDDEWTDNDAFIGINSAKGYYWSGSSFNSDNDDAWLSFLNRGGDVFSYSKTYDNAYVWPVHSTN